MTDEHIYYNALALAHYGDHLILKKLNDAHGNWTAAYQQTQGGSRRTAEKEWHRLNASGARLILNADLDFPPLLREIPWQPHGLYVRGAAIGPELKIAMIGTRRATPVGLATATAIARDCCRAGLTIVSGLAFGIDAASHQSTLKNNGKAIAVLASGINDITPRSNAKLGEQILAQGGTIISEYPLDIPANKKSFIERNRIVSGLSRGAIIIEAPESSGTLATARFAVDQNRELFVVPGGVTNPNYTGSHALIKAGATLITCANDVLDALGLLPAKSRTQPLPFLDGTQQRIVELLSTSDTPLSADVLAQKLKLVASVATEALALLTIEGIVKEDSGAYYM